MIKRTYYLIYEDVLFFVLIVLFAFILIVSTFIRFED